MSRRREANKRKIIPDPKYSSRLVAKFVNVLMFDGKKSTAERSLYKALNRLAGKSGVTGTTELSEEALKLFKKAIENVKPVAEVKSRRVGGATYQVPVEVLPARKEALAIRWLIIAARSRNDRTMDECLANEFADASASPPRGNAIKKREEVHRMVEANKAFAHLGRY